MPLYRYIVSLLLLSLLLAPPLSAYGQGIQATVTVAPDKEYAVNGVSDIQPIMSVVANGGSRGKHIAETRELNLPGTRLYLWVSEEGFWQQLPKTMPQEEKVARFLALDFDSIVPQWFDRGLKIEAATGRRKANVEPTSQFRQLELLEEWNAKKNIVLHLGQSHPRTSADFAPYGRYYRACLREIRKRFPDLNVRFVMLYNEPDYEYPRVWEKRTKSESIAFLYQFFTSLQADIHKEFPQITLIGPGIANFTNWANRKDWTLPFLQQQPEAKYFNAQVYTDRFEDLLAWTSLLQADSLRLKGQRIPAVITEFNVDLSKPAEDWWQDKYHVRRVHNEAEVLFRMMERPDLFAFKSYFLYLWQGDFRWAQMWLQHDGKEESAPTYKLFHVLRYLRGKRVYSAVNRESSPIRTIAARNGSELIVALFNSDTNTQTIQLRCPLPQGKTVASLTEEALFYQKSQEKFVSRVTPLSALPKSLRLLPGEVRTLRWKIFEGDTLKKWNEQEYYAPETALSAQRGKGSVTLRARTVRKNEVVFLRTAIYLHDTQATQKMTWRLNGHAVEQRASLPTGYKKAQPILYIEKAVPANWVQSQNVLRFETQQDTPYRIMFASLIFRPSSNAAAYVPAAIHSITGVVANKKTSQTAERKPDIAIFDHRKTEGWIFPTQSPNDAAGLHLRNNGQVLLLRDSLHTHQDVQGMTTVTTLRGFEKLTSPVAGADRGNTRFIVNARLFWTPKLPEGYLEPYTMSDVLTFLVEYREGERLRLTLFSKVNGKDGFGNRLWTGVLEVNELPLSISVWFNASDYRLRFDKPVETADGSLSGQHGLPTELWHQPVRYGVKSVYGGVPGNAVIQSVRIRYGK